MQVIGETFRRYSLPPYNRDVYDPLSNILASIRYSLDRYGSLARAWKGRGYAKGGFFLNGPEIGMFGEGGPEMALPLIGRYMQPYAQAVANNLADIFSGQRSVSFDPTGMGPFVIQVNLNGRVIAEETYEDIQDLQERSKARTRRAKGEVI